MKKAITFVLTIFSFCSSGILSSQNIGINTTNPQTSLQVADDHPATGGMCIGTGIAGTGGNLRLLSNVNHWNLDNSNGNLRFFTETNFGIGGDVKAIINQQGRMGIGTSNPFFSLHAANDNTLNNGVTIGTGTANDGASLRWINNTTHWNLDNANGNLRFYTETDFGSGTTLRAAINNSGNIGIGLSDPIVRLDVQAVQAGEPSVISRGGPDFSVPSSEILNIGHWNGLQFLNRMAMSSNGFVGIGTTSPGTLLDILRNSPPLGAAVCRVEGVNVGHTDYDLISLQHGAEAVFRLSADGEVNISKGSVMGGTTLLQAEVQNVGHSDYNLFRAIHGNGTRFQVRADGRVGINHLSSNWIFTVRPQNSGVHPMALSSFSNSGGANIVFRCRNNQEVIANGTITAGSKNFIIDHPLAPATKTLRHACIESPDMKNIYDGMVVLNEFGEAIVELPAYFQSLNKDYRYLLTCVGTYGPVYISEKINNNRFKIAGGHPGMEIHWQVTGNRQDPAVLKHPMVVEMDKTETEKGLYHHPEAYGFPLSKGIGSKDE